MAADEKAIMAMGYLDFWGQVFVQLRICLTLLQIYPYISSELNYCERIGAGQFGEVWRSRHTASHNVLAVKVVQQPVNFGFVSRLWVKYLTKTLIYRRKYLVAKRQANRI